MGNSTLKYFLNLQVINKSIELEIFDLLYKDGGEISVEDLAKKKNYKRDVLARLLNCLTALKLVAKTRKDGKGKGRHSKMQF